MPGLQPSFDKFARGVNDPDEQLNGGVLAE